MNRLKKVLVICLSLAMVFSLASCGGGGAPTYPEETVKIGVLTFDTAGDQFIAMQEYLDYVSEGLNVEIVYSESINNAEQELSFIESCAASGCAGVVGYYNIAREQSIQLAIDKGMYYFGVAEEDSVYEAFKDNPMYLGGVYNESADYDSGYAMGQALVEAGCEKVIWSAGGRDFGIQMFIDRDAGFQAAIAEADYDVEIVDVSGFPGTDAFSSKSTAALSTPGVDGLASSFGLGYWLTPIANAGLSDTMKVAGIDSVNGMYSDLFANGTAVCNVAEQVESFVAAVPMIINALEGNPEVNRDNGLAPRLVVNRWIITNAEDYEMLLALETGGDFAVSIDEIKQCIKSQNPDASYETFATIYGEVSPEAIEARRQ